MKKTISVHIGGRLFNIEEAAYNKLSKYLNTIRGYFSNEESAEEILSDIELRIAELFMERVTPQKEVITERDVDDIISIMGQPEDYVDVDDTGEEDASQTYSRKSTTKQVFRDPDNKVVAGVCSGISAYFGIDPIILRALFVIVTIFYGSGVIIYLVLAVIIPKAKTTAEKLQMRGEPVTVENISRKVSESFHTVKEDLKDFGKKNNIHQESFDKAKKNAEHTTNTVIEELANALKLILVILTKAIGVVLLIAGVVVIFVSLALGFGWETILAFNLPVILDNTHLLPFVLSSVFENVDQKTMFSIGLLLTLIVPGISFLLMGMRLLFDFKKTPVWSGVLLVIVWFAGVGLLAASGTGVYRNFRVSASFTEKVPLNLPVADTLYIDLLPQKNTKYEFTKGFKNRKFYYDYDVTYPGVESTNILYMGDIEFTVEMKSADTLYNLIINRKANGATRADAVKNAENVTSIAEIVGDSLLFNPYYAVLKEGKIRNQQISYVLQVPVGKAVHFNKNSKSILYDVPNITNTYDGRMVNHTWLMTQNGLFCTTCKSSSYHSKDRDD